MQRLNEVNDPAQRAATAFLERREGALADYRFLPLVGKNKDMVLDAHSGDPVGAIGVDPWIEGG